MTGGKNTNFDKLRTMIDIAHNKEFLTSKPHPIWQQLPLFQQTDIQHRKKRGK